MKKVLLLLVIAMLSGCASSGVQMNTTIPQTAKIGILQFSDCAIPQHEDCIASGKKASAEYAKVFETTVLVRPVDMSETDNISTKAAAALAKTYGFDYVITGQVTDRYDVAPFTFRVDRAGVNLQVLKTSDASQSAVQVIPSQNAGSNLATPESLFNDFAKMLKDEVFK